MTFRPIVALGAAALLALLPARVYATTVEPSEFKTLVSRADYVVRGVVKSVTSEWRNDQAKPYIISKVTVEVLETIRGSAPQTLVLELLGGKVGDDHLVISGSPEFKVGDEDILFLKNNNTLFTPLVGVMYGRYPIVRDAKSGVAYAVRNNGMPLYSENDVATSMEKLSAVRSSNSAAKPMTAATFSTKIRSVATTNSDDANAK